jgi:23S rRNA (cytosine1962-C5)-methyltransferase
LYEDADVLVVDKPAHMVCQAVDRERPLDDLPGAIKHWLAARRGVTPDVVYLGIHQRLDQQTSGAILFTLQKSSNPAIAAQFAERAIEKTYLAAVSGKPPAPGTLLAHWLAPGERGSMRVSTQSDPQAKEARTRVLGVRSVHGRSLLTLALETGRTHQVRVQLAAAGCPVAGDARYGGAPALRLLLHAQALAFARPSDGERIALSSPPPLEFEDWLQHGARSALSDPDLLQRALELAVQRRWTLARAQQAGDTDAYRLLNGAADGIPGFAVDVYDRWLVLRVDGDEETPEERALLAQLSRLGCLGVYAKRHPKQANRLVDPKGGQVASLLPAWGEPAPAELIVHERGVPFEVRLADGLRTGMFLDQRDNRARLRGLAAGKRVLNLFGYTGSFSVAALLGGATAVTTVDVSRTALAWAERNVARVGRSERHRSIADDAFNVLSGMAQRGERFDLIVLDPPSYSTTKRGRFRALTDYAELCAHAIQVLTEPGTLLACINHEGVSVSALRRFVHDAARAQGRSLQNLRDLPSGDDFPSAFREEPSMKSLLAELGPRGTVTNAGANAARALKRNPTRPQKTRR